MMLQSFCTLYLGRVLSAMVYSTIMLQFCDLEITRYWFEKLIVLFLKLFVTMRKLLIAFKNWSDVGIYPFSWVV